MYEWPDELQMVRQAVRQFVDAEIRPLRDELEHGDQPPYDILRKLFRTFGMDALARDTFKRRLDRQRAGEANDDLTASAGGEFSMVIPLVIELSRCSPGLVGALGVSIGLAAATIMSRGTIEQQERWALDLLTFDKIGAWAITEPESGSDAIGSMKSSARRDGDEYVLNGNKTFITNGPYADTVVVYVKLDEGNDPRDRKVLTFVLDSGMPGFEQSKPFRKMGFHSSPTGELFMTDVRVGRDRLLGGTEGEADAGRDSAKANFVVERANIAAMCLGVIEECLALSVDYAKNRVQFGKPIGEFQLIQLKLAKMEVARLNVENLMLRMIEMARAGKTPTLAEASAMKLYAAQATTEVAMEAVQLFGGNGYMAEFHVEQLARDAKSFQIYAGTDEIQITHIARDLLSR
ncbi:MAG: acyl-CoA dehydrogenase family protein [Acidimicrobiales bacterium]